MEGTSQTQDGNYIMDVHTSSYGAGNFDALIAKLDSNGTVIWAKTIGGTGIDAGTGRSIQTTDGGYIQGRGYTESYGQGGPSDFWVSKIDSLGNFLWAKTYHISTDHGWDFYLTHDKGYIIGGHSGNAAGSGSWDATVIKIDSIGNVMWAKSWGGPIGYATCITSLEQTQDRGYIVCGWWGTGTDTDDIIVTKLDSLGKIMWIKNYSGASAEHGYGVINTSDGGYIIVGETYSYGAGGQDVLVMKLNSIGDTVWVRTFGGPLDDWAKSICATSDGCCIVTGSTFSYGAGGYDLLFIKLTSTGNIVWAKTFGGVGDEKVSDVSITLDSGYIVSGRTTSWGEGLNDCLLIKLESDGSIGGSCPPLQPCSPNVTFPSLIITTPTPNETSPAVTVADCTPIVTSPILVETNICNPASVEENKKPSNIFNLFQNCPNPFIGTTEIEYGLPQDAKVNISIYNLSGQKVATLVNENKKAGYYTINWDGKDIFGKRYASGIYFYKLETNNYTVTKKMYFIR
ncbi:MAG: T9SS type A sorting domain-containing protein [Candidatus Stahlbacteria bacterium]|nr:T9SS type A sorting domain-containing protein [Candidatus Stahlbacteria bacterium]